jgi:imidazoleglycerol-phosphate dehydratase
MPLPARTASISRSTNETKVQVSISLDGGVLLPYEPSQDFPAPYSQEAAEAAKIGIVPPSDASHATQFTPTQQITINTGIGFLDHMLHALAKHSGWSLAIRAEGDLYSMDVPCSVQNDHGTDWI